MYSQLEIETRESLIASVTRYLATDLNKVNSAFRFTRIETPILLPYSVELGKDESVSIKRSDGSSIPLRQSTVKQAYEVIRAILNGSLMGRQRLPIVVWQHGKVFQQSADEIKEVYSLEYQVLFANSTGMAYLPLIVQTCTTILRKHCGTIRIIGDKLYSEDNGTVLVTIKERPDFWAGKNIEIVFDMDNCTAAYLRHPSTS